MTKSISIPVDYHSAPKYDSGRRSREPLPFEMEIDDRRKTDGFAHIEMAPSEGETGDSFGVRVEVNKLPDTETLVQCVHLHIEDELQLSIFKMGDSLIIRPECNVEIRKHDIDQSGATVWIAK